MNIIIDNNTEPHFNNIQEINQQFIVQTVGDRVVFYDPSMKIQGTQFLSNYLIKQIAVGKYHYLSLTSQWQVFSFGSNSNGQLGIGEKNEQYFQDPQEINYFKNMNVLQISVGDTHNLALTVTDGEQIQIFKWGQLGINSEIEFEPKNIKIQNISAIFCPKNNNIQYISANPKLIFCGSNHGFILFDDGSLYSYGRNEQGQLGLLDSIQIIDIPQKILFPNNALVERFFIGPQHSFAIMKNGNVYSWGASSFGQLGISEYAVMKSTPTLISDFFTPQFVQVFQDQIQLILTHDSTLMLINKELKGLQFFNSKQIKNPIFVNKQQSVTQIYERDVNSRLSTSTTQKLEKSQKNDPEVIYSKLSTISKKLQNREKEEEQDIIQQIFNGSGSENMNQQLIKEWESDIIPYWGETKISTQLNQLCRIGIPPVLRSKIWQLAIPNRLSITENYFQICSQKAFKLLKYMDEKKKNTINETIATLIDSYMLD